MSEKFCPLVLQEITYEHEIPEICQQTCRRLWDIAIGSLNFAGDYDPYLPDDDEEEFGCVAGTEISDSSLVAVGEHDRNYVIVDQCIKHGVQTGEQGYYFLCPLRIEK